MKAPPSDRFLQIYMPQDERDLLTRLMSRYRERGWGDVSPGWVMRWALQALATESGIEHEFRERLFDEAFPDPLQEIYDRAKEAELEDE